MDDQTSRELAELMNAIQRQDAADEGAVVTEVDDEPEPRARRLPADVDRYVLKGRRPYGPPRHVFVTWRDQDLFMAPRSLMARGM